MVKQIFGLIGLLIFLSTQAVADVVASIDKNPVIVNESFILTITADDDIDSNALDTQPLLNNFVVGRTSVSSQTSMVNFKTTRLTKWTTLLIAKKEGKYTIPSFTLDGQSTQPISLTVIKASDSTAKTQQDIFITNDISSKEIFVQQQITLTVKLHFSSELKRGNLTEPSLAGANIAQIGKDKENETIINGRRYRVIERTYAISPQQSGSFIIKSPLFSGEIIEPSARRGNFLSFAETKPVSVVGEEIAITVKPIPSDYQGVWLPSELLALHQEWQPAPSTFKVGEPITRVITLTAAGLSKEQLPAIDMKMPKGLKVYPDQAELHSGVNNNRLVSQKVRNFAIVASKAGEYLLPEIIIPWWNTQTNRMEQAIIPEQRITIAPNEDAAELPTPPQQNTNAVTTEPETPNTPQPGHIIIEKTPWLQWLFLGLWIITCIAWWFSAKRKPTTKQGKNSDNTHNNSDRYLALVAACKQHNSSKVMSLIVPWYNQISTKRCSTLPDVCQYINNPSFDQAIATLQQASYGTSPSAWQGDQLLVLLSQINKELSGSNKQPKRSLSLNP